VGQTLVCLVVSRTDLWSLKHKCDNNCGAICLIAPLRPQGGAIKQIAPPHQRRVVAFYFSKTVGLLHYR
jgi:hypothetical protein